MRSGLRQDRLNRRISLYAEKGWHVESRSDFQATIAQGREKLPNTINLILTVSTGGLWLIYWLFARGKGRVLITVDESGELHEQLIGGRYELKRDTAPPDPEAETRLRAEWDAMIGDEWRRGPDAT